jgi:hypothetical protein
MRRASKQKTAQEEAARQEIAKIRQNGFDPGDDMVNKVIRTSGPVRALVIMRLAALADRKIFSEVH